MENLDIKKIEDWGMNLQNPLWIAGPCSAETEEQVLGIATALKDSDISVFRAGIWKPRTRPGSFEGVGSEGLEWLMKAKKILNKPVSTEVANGKHVEEALKAGIDILWLGARTTVNPFSVQEVCDALKGTDIPVLVKNPINPDLQLWIGAIERLAQAGIDKIGAIHRGFSVNVPTRFRNKPEWSYPIHLKRLFPSLTVISDPSHICGNREMIEEISQRALNFGIDGLMIETHTNPDSAWSDAKQQVTPDVLNKILSNLELRQSIEDAPEFKSELDQLRENVDILDHQIIETLSERFKAIVKIGDYKSDHNLAVFQKDRWDEVIQSRINEATGKGLSEKFIKNILMDIHEESIRLQESRLSDLKNKKVDA